MQNQNVLDFTMVKCEILIHPRNKEIRTSRENGKS